MSIPLTPRQDLLIYKIYEKYFKDRFRFGEFIDYLNDIVRRSFTYTILKGYGYEVNKSNGVYHFSEGRGAELDFDASDNKGSYKIRFKVREQRFAKFYYYNATEEQRNSVASKLKQELDKELSKDNRIKPNTSKTKVTFLDKYNPYMPTYLAPEANKPSEKEADEVLRKKFGFVYGLSTWEKIAIAVAIIVGLAFLFPAFGAFIAGIIKSIWTAITGLLITILSFLESIFKGSGGKVNVNAEVGNDGSYSAKMDKPQSISGDGSESQTQSGNSSSLISGNSSSLIIALIIFVIVGFLAFKLLKKQ
ncbi:MAG: hypothetical protein ABIL45_04275 [candidate division WOR-3 bacterium]